MYSTVVHMFEPRTIGESRAIISISLQLASTVGVPLLKSSSLHCQRRFRTAQDTLASIAVSKKSSREALKREEIPAFTVLLSHSYVMFHSLWTIRTGSWAWSNLNSENDSELLLLVLLAKTNWRSQWIKREHLPARQASKPL